MPSFDVHQHLWPEEVLSVLSRRPEPPLARRRRGIWDVQPVSEPSFTSLEPSTGHEILACDNAQRLLGLARVAA